MSMFLTEFSSVRRAICQSRDQHANLVIGTMVHGSTHQINNYDAVRAACGTRPRPLRLAHDIRLG
jgi:hypothetical protein